MRSLLLLVSLFLFSCGFESIKEKLVNPMSQDVEALIVEVNPVGHVLTSSVVSLTWTGSWKPAEDIFLRDIQDRRVDAHVELSETQINLEPKMDWPLGRILGEVRFQSSTGETEKFSFDFYVVADSAVDVAPPPKAESESKRPPKPRFSLRRPPTASTVTADLSWIYVLDDTPSILVLRQDTLNGMESKEDTHFVQRHEFELAKELCWAGGCIFRIPKTGKCSGLCPQELYRVYNSETKMVLGTLLTEEQVDSTKLELVDVQQNHGPGQLNYLIHASKVVKGFGRWQVRGQASIFGDLVMDQLPNHIIRLSANRLPPVGFHIDVDIVLEDYFGNTIDYKPDSIRVQSTPQVRISEYVSTPRKDWGDSIPAGVPFDAFPGLGSVTSADEWIELVNESSYSVDLKESALLLKVFDGSPEVTRLADAKLMYFGDGGDKKRWLPGEALVVHPKGTVNQGNAIVEIWAGSVLLDRWILGSQADALHPSGAPTDLLHESIAWTEDGQLAWCVPTPGDSRANSDCLVDQIQ